MQRYSNKPRRPKAKAVENRPARPPAVPADGGEWHEILTRGLFTALGIFIALQLVLAIAGSPPAIAAAGDHIAIDAASVRFGAGAPVLNGREGAGREARSCKLDLAIMKHPGGVLSVLQAGPGGVLLSWAGGATAPRAANCLSREIMVSADDYATLLTIGPRNINAR